MTIIDGKEVAAKLRKEIAAEVEAWVSGLGLSTGA